MKLPRKSIVSYLVTLCYGTALVIPSLSGPASAFAEEGSRDKAIRRFNIKPTTPLRQAIYQGDALVSQELIKEGGQPATPIVMDYLAQQGGQWLNQFGRAKIAIQGDPLRSLQGQAALLLPIKQNEQWLWFAQGGWVQSKHRSTFSLGTGQRQFYSKQGYWGNNLFFDYQPQGNHCRLGLGLELGYQAFSNQINGYLPLSGAHLINSRADQANPARGIDIRLRYQPPQWPYWRFSVTGDHYWGTIATAGSLSLVENPTALTAGIHYTPIPLVVLGYHLRWNLPGKRVHQLSCSLNYRLGIPWEQQVDRQQAMRQSLEMDRLKLVSRHHEMVLQQQPNDEIKLEIENISSGEHQPGSTIQVRVRIKTPRPLNEWQFSWVGGMSVNIQPSIKATEGNQIVTLPSKSGTYTLQLQGRNIRGVVVCSNLLMLEISSAKTVTTPNMDSGNLKDHLSGLSRAELIVEEQRDDRSPHVRNNSVDDSAKDSPDTPVIIVEEKRKKPLRNKNRSQLTKENLELLQHKTEIDQGIRGHILQWIDMLNGLDNFIDTKERLKNFDKEYNVELEQLFEEIGCDPEYIKEKEKIYELNKKESFDVIGHLTSEKESVLSTKFLSEDDLYFVKNIILLYREVKKHLIDIDNSN